MLKSKGTFRNYPVFFFSNLEWRSDRALVSTTGGGARPRQNEGPMGAHGGASRG